MVWIPTSRMSPYYFKGVKLQLWFQIMKGLKAVVDCRWFCLQPVDCFVQEENLNKALVIFVSFVTLWPAPLLMQDIHMSGYVKTSWLLRETASLQWDLFIRVSWVQILSRISRQKSWCWWSLGRKFRWQSFRDAWPSRTGNWKLLFYSISWAKSPAKCILPLCNMLLWEVTSGEAALWKGSGFLSQVAAPV